MKETKKKTKLEIEDEIKAETPVDWIRFRAYIHRVELLEKRMENLEKEFGIFGKLYKLAEENEKPIDEVLLKVEEQVSNPKQLYRDVVDEILGKDFGIESESRGEGIFQFNIIVPERFSNLNSSEYKAMGGDKRGKVLTTVEGKNGVILFCEKIKKNLGQSLAK